MLSFSRNVLRYLASPLASPTRSISFRRLVTRASAGAATEEKNSILVNWSKEKNEWSKFHFDWLRDNCPCSACKHPDYNQRLLNTLEDATPAHVDVKGSDAVEIRWKDGHYSSFSYNWLLANSYCHSPVVTRPPAAEKREITLWDADGMVTPPEMDFNDILKDDKNLLAFLKLVYQYGICFVPGIPPNNESMLELAKRIGQIQNTYYGGQWYMDAGDMVVSHVSYAKAKIPPHTDCPAFCGVPGLTYFHAIAFVDGKGGCTTLIDGFKLADTIKRNNPEHFALLSKVSILYDIEYKNVATYKARRYTFTLDDNDEMSAFYLNQADRQPLDEKSLSEAKEVLSCDANEAMTKMYQALRHLHRLIYSDQFVYRCDLRPGKMLVMNNKRILHGRDELITGFRRLCGSYHHEEEWMSKLKMLERFN